MLKLVVLCTLLFTPLTVTESRVDGEYLSLVPTQVVEVEFDEPVSLQVGALVVKGDSIIGKVRKNKENGNKVALELTENINNKKFVALVSFPLSSVQKPQAIIELLPADSSSSPSEKIIKGFSSIESYWLNQA